MKRLNLTIIVVLCCSFSGICQQVTRREAINAAVNTMRYYGRTSISNNMVDNVFTMVNQGDTLLYEVHFETGETVLLSGHKACEPVLGYITEGQGETILNQYDQIPDGLRDFVDGYAAYSQYFFDTVSELLHLSDWEALQTYDRNREIQRVVLPLTKSKWGQSRTTVLYYQHGVYGDTVQSSIDNHAYNHLILDICEACDDEIYSPAGCSAIAMAQIMYYWKYPVFMEDSIKQYDWCNMPDELGNYLSLGVLEPEYEQNLYSIQRNAVATLIRDCAGRAETNFCANNECKSSSGPIRTKNAFKDFGFNDVDLKWKAFHQNTWKTLLKADLDKGYPICYSSGNVITQESHMYICDGYNDDNLFSFNWGWRGNHNGCFYPLDSLENMNDLQSAIFNIVPDENDDYCDFTLPLQEHYSHYYTLLGNTTPAPYENVPSTATNLISVPNSSQYPNSWRTIPSGASARYMAHEDILLQDGFMAEEGCSFHAYIVPCESCEGSRGGYRPSNERGDDFVIGSNSQPSRSTQETSVSSSIIMTIFPNPVTNTFNIRLGNHDETIQIVEVFNLLGSKVIMSEDNAQTDIDATALQKGMYLVRVKGSSGNVYFGKFVKE